LENWKYQTPHGKRNNVKKKLFCHNGDIVLQFSELNKLWKLLLQSSSAKIATPPSPTSTRQGQDLWRLEQAYQQEPYKKQFLVQQQPVSGLAGTW